MSKPQINENPLCLVAEKVPLLEASLQGLWKVTIVLGVMLRSCHLNFDPEGCEGAMGQIGDARWG